MTERADLPDGMPCEDCEQGLSTCCLEPAEGCPDCGQDTVAVDDDGGEYCTSVRCGWRP